MTEATSNPDCDFCGAVGVHPDDLVQGGGEQAGGLPVVHICRECVAACADALATEERISGPPARPEPSVEPSDEHPSETRLAKPTPDA